MPYDKNQKFPEYKIYKLCCDDTDLFYVGSTRDFTTRKSRHKTGCNNQNGKEYNTKKYQTMREFGGFQNWRMVCIDILYDVTKLEAEIREEEMRMELKALLNSQKASCGGISVQEYKKKYREENRDHYKQYDKKYFDKNREKIRTKQKEKFDCQCGGRYTRVNKAIHFKSQLHQKYLNSLEKET